MAVANREHEDFIAEIRRLQKSPAEVAAFLAGARRFDPLGWRREAPPATPAELADMEAFLLEREIERQHSLASEPADE